jgi:proteasome beta subunit
MAHDPETGRGAPQYETGTTTVGVVGDDGVVLAADRRASLGGRFVANKSAMKIEQVHPTAAATIAGSVGGAQAFLRRVRAETSLYGTRRGEPMSLTALSTLAGDLLRGQPVSPLLGGVDGTGPHLFQLDGGGGVMEDSYAATGSGMQLAYGVLERRFEPGQSLDAAEDVATDAVAAASERDTASGNGVTVARVTDEGVELVEDAGNSGAAATGEVA